MRARAHRELGSAEGRQRLATCETIRHGGGHTRFGRLLDKFVLDDNTHLAPAALAFFRGGFRDDRDRLHVDGNALRPVEVIERPWASLLAVRRYCQAAQT